MVQEERCFGVGNQAVLQLHVELLSQGQQDPSCPLLRPLITLHLSVAGAGEMLYTSQYQFAGQFVIGPI